MSDANYIFMKQPSTSVQHFSTKMLKKLFIILFLLGVLYTILVNADFISVPINQTSGRLHNKQILKVSYKCQTDLCEKELIPENVQEISLETCSMTCGMPQLWPKPKTFTEIKRSYSAFNPEAIYFHSNNIDDDLLTQQTLLFINKLAKLVTTNYDISSENSLDITITYLNVTNNKLSLSTNESYSIEVQPISMEHINVVLVAENYFGVRHGLETLLQLIWVDHLCQEVRILQNLNITDWPSFPYRGLMVDTARNYISLNKLQKVLDGMSMVKLNVFHWHITDAQSFPLVLPSNPTFAKAGAYSPEQVYTESDVRELVEYAKVRGIRVLLEIDAPGHIGAGWESDPELVICNDNNEPFSGHLNPNNSNALTILRDIYVDLLNLMGNDELFHIGNDEVNLKCFSNNSKQDWEDYTLRMLNELKTANSGKMPKSTIMWSSPLTDSMLKAGKLRNMTIQFWLGNPKPVLQAGHHVIYSTVDAWYLDCGFGNWNSQKVEGVCDPYRPWQKFYKYRPWLVHGHREQVLGGEACLWTEEVSEASVETRIWPRTAAFAERVWADPADGNLRSVGWRLAAFTERMVQVGGIEASAIWPQWCTKNPSKC